MVMSFRSQAVVRAGGRMRGALLLLGLLASACSSDAASDPLPTPNSSDNAGKGGTNGDTPSVGSGSTFKQAAGRASGAKVRVFNAYVPLDGSTPGPIEIYSHAWATAADEPLISVPYGTLSEFFDPGVYDERGDTFIAVYWAGTSGDENSLISKSETLKTGDVITYLVTPSSNKQNSGRRYATLQSFAHGEVELPFGADTPTAGKAILVVDSVGVEAVLSEPNRSSFYFSLGDGCAKAAGDSEFFLTAVGPATSGTYVLDPGAYNASIHEQLQSDEGDAPNCDGDPIAGDIALDLSADQAALLFLYAPEDRDFKTAFIPLDK